MRGEAAAAGWCSLQRAVSERSTIRRDLGDAAHLCSLAESGRVPSRPGDAGAEPTTSSQRGSQPCGASLTDLGNLFLPFPSAKPNVLHLL